ncbi:hypothetical protein GCM10028774_16290 [Spirosoma jeollabukense]
MNHIQKVMNKKILLIGRNTNVLASLAEALTHEGFVVKTTNLVEQASQDFNAAEFDLIAFGRGVDEQTNTLLKADFLAQRASILFVDGLAPITTLLVKQIQLALADSPLANKVITEFSCQQHERLIIHITVVTDCQLLIDLYQLDAVHHTQQKTLVNTFVAAGNHSFIINLQTDGTSTINFLVAEVTNLALAVLPLQ